jgi:hypothetical protein
MTSDTLDLRATTNLNNMTEEEDLAFRHRMSKFMMEIINRKIAEGSIKSSFFDIDEKGSIIVDKEKDLDLYDWAVNG